MRPLDWRLLLEVPLEDDDDDTVYEDLYEQLAEFDPKDVEDSSKLQRLFEVTKHIMKLKAIQAEVAIEELEKAEMTGQDTTGLLKEIAELREQIRKADRQMGSGNEVGQLEAQLKVLRSQLQQKELELEQEKQSLEKYVSLLSETEKERKALKVEVSALQVELEEKFNQLERVESAIEASQLESDSKLNAKLKEKNKQISQLLSDIQDYEQKIRRQEERIEDMKSSLIEATEQMDVAAEELSRIKEKLNEVKKANEDLVEENRRLTQERDDIEAELKLKIAEMEELTLMYSKECTSMNDMISRQNEEIARYREDIHVQKATIEELQLSNEQSTVNILRRALEDRNMQVQQLKEHLEQATKDIEDNTLITESLRQQLEQLRGDGTRSGFKKPNRWLELHQKLKENNLLLKSTQEMLNKAEEEGREKDKQLTEVLVGMKKYEMGEYGLADAVAEIKQLKKRVLLRDREIENITQQLNQLQNEVEDVSEENSALREKLHIDPDTQFSPHLRKGAQWTKNLQNEIARLEDENVDLKHRLHQAMKTKAARSPTGSAKRRRRERATQVSPHKENQVLEEEQRVPPPESNKLQHYVSELEDENRDLRLGMEEILRSIREQDERSDILIECPVLERLVEALMSRNGEQGYRYDIDARLQDENRKLKAEIKALKLHYQSRIEDTEAKVMMLQTAKQKDPVAAETMPCEDTSIKPKIEFSKADIADILERSATTDEMKVSCQQSLQVPDALQEKLGSSTSLAELFRQLFAERIALRSIIEGHENERLSLVDEAARNKVNAERYQELLTTMTTDSTATNENFLKLEKEIGQLKMERDALCRHCKVLKNTESFLLCQLGRERALSVVKNNVILEQLERLESQEEIASHRVRSLQDALEKTLPKEIFQSLLEQHTKLSAKFKYLLDQFDSSEYLPLKDKVSTMKEMDTWNEINFDPVEDRDITDDTELSAQCARLEKELSFYKSKLENTTAMDKSTEAEVDLMRNENRRLRETLHIVQSQDDDHFKSGQVRQQLLESQMAEAMMVKEVDNLKNVLEKTNAEYFALQKRYQDKVDELLKTKMKSHVRIQELTKVLKELRFQYSGFIPVERQEKLLSLLAKFKVTRGVPDQSVERSASAVAGGSTPQEALSYFEKRVTELEAENLQLQQEVHSKQLEFEEREMEMETLRKELEYIRETAGAITCRDEVMSTLRGQNEEYLETKRKLKALHQELMEARKNVTIANNSLQVKDKVIEELRSVLPTRDISELSASAEYYKLKRSINIAMTTVGSLQALLKQKESTLSRYREWVSNLREELANEKRRFAAKIYEIQNELMAKREESIHNLKEEASQLCSPKKSSCVENVHQLDEIHKLEVALAARSQVALLAEEQLQCQTEELNRLRAEVETTRHVPVDNTYPQNDPEFSLKSAPPALQKMSKTTMTSFDGANDQEAALAAALQAELSETKAALGERDAEIQDMKEKLESAQIKAKQAPSTDISHLVQRLKNQVDEKEKQLQALSKALIELRSEMMAAVETSLLQQPSRSTYLDNEEDVATLKETISKLEVKLAHMKSDMSAMSEREQFLNDEVRLMKEEADKIRHRMAKTDEENERLHKKTERLRNMLQKQAQPEAQTEREKTAQLQRELVLLRQQVKNAAESGGLREQQAKITNTRTEVARWEDGKRWKLINDKLKRELEDVSQKLERSERAVHLLRAQADRLERDKNALEAKLTKLQAKHSDCGEDSVTVITALQKRIAELESEVQGCDEAPDSKRAQLRMQNKVLRERIRKLEKQVLHRDLARKVTRLSPKQNGSTLKGDLITATEDVKWSATENIEVIRNEKIETKRISLLEVKAARGDAQPSLVELEKYRNQVAILLVTVDRLQDELDRLTKKDDAAETVEPNPASPAP
ncbi:centrosomal protein of 290 kDa-like [Ornithodoros turicata]|uniref:centrosomal protein of 290 kDa-like n=1 Tax=Ornithodoros turicata TaxID=34597 RepID=UPI003138776D